MNLALKSFTSADLMSAKLEFSTLAEATHTLGVWGMRGGMRGRGVMCDETGFADRFQLGNSLREPKAASESELL